MRESEDHSQFANSEQGDPEMAHYLAENHRAMANAISYLLMRINRIEDRLNIGIDDHAK
jgi:hypothetical protein